MCGIIGYLGSDYFYDYIFSGLKLLQNRGYDSVGISYIENSTLITKKYASTNTNNSLEKLEKEIEKNKTLNKNSNYNAIGHTRWATHGGKTDINAHPHSDNLNRIAIVHNGIIENYLELKNGLLSEGYSFQSQTDTEIISVLIGKYLDKNNSVENSIKLCLEQLLGTWALAIIHCDYPDKIWVTRNGSPLLIGLDDEYILIASEQIAFHNYIKKYIVLENHDILEITKKNNIIHYSKNIQRYKMNKNLSVDIELYPTNYDHWMIKEILEQPKSVERAINNGGRIENNVKVKLGGLDSYRNNLLEIEHLILLGCGTSFYAGLWSLDIFKFLHIFNTVTIYDGAEFSEKDIPNRGKTGVIFLSQSGETKDLHRCIQIAKDQNLITIGVVNVVDSLISRETDCGVYLNAGREVAVASTKSFTNQCIVLTLIAVWFSQNIGTMEEKRRKIISDLQNLPYQISILFEKIDEIKNISLKLVDKKSIFLLGKGKDEAIAKEGSLKLKEIGYIHAEGYSSSALKHGPFSLIEKDLPIILFDLNDEYREKNNNAYNEVSARGALVIIITDSEIKRETVIKIPKNVTFGGLLGNICIQLLSYYLALELGHNPDFPRNLAKVVTVE
jgi:glucosamine--fructose-6-phosphate aminotransferase (isomerizing)